MYQRALCSLSLVALIPHSFGCSEQTSQPTPHAQEASEETTSMANATSMRPGAARSQTPPDQPTSAKSPPSKELAPPPEALLKRTRNTHQVPTSVAAYAPNDDSFPGSRLLIEGMDSARREAEDGALELGEVEFSEGWLIGRRSTTRVSWEDRSGKKLWERAFRLTPDCSGRWNLDAMASAERIYIWTYEDRSYKNGMRLVKSPGPCSGKLVLTVLEKRTGETITGAIIAGVAATHRLVLFEDNLLAVHEKWVRQPGNQCDDGPCHQTIERAWFLDAKTLERKHYFEDFGPIE